MRGPSDSGKQNGFTASQWEMFHSKQLDAITVNIFNSFLMKHLYNDASELEKWQELYKPDLEDDYSLENTFVINGDFRWFLGRISFFHYILVQLLKNKNYST